MNKNFLAAVFLIGITIIVEACSKKTLPVISSRTTEPIKKEEKKSSIIPDLAVGKSVFMSNCGKCHDLPLPEQYTAQRWDGILSTMIPKAKLNQEQRVHVTAYLKANAFK